MLEQLRLPAVNQITNLPATKTSVTDEQNHPVWAQILAALPDGDRDGPGEPPAPALTGLGELGPPGQRQPIPITKLRRLYELLGILTSLESHLAIATEFGRVPDRLARYFQDSLEHFSRYDNTEPFIPRHPPRRSLPTFTEVSTISGTRDLTAFLDQNRDRIWDVENDPSLRFRYVERELVPARTTGNAVYEDQTPASCGKRLDWLLRNEQDTTPIIAEVKVGNDKSPFFALIQLLMYASELVTHRQLRRLLVRHAAGAFYANDPDGPEEPNGINRAVSLYVILSGYNYNSPVRERLLDVTTQLSHRLVREVALAPFIRRIACIEATLKANNHLCFRKKFCYPELQNHATIVAPGGQ